MEEDGGVVNRLQVDFNSRVKVPCKQNNLKKMSFL